MAATVTDIDLAQEEEKILTAAVAKALKAVKKDSSVANLKKLEANKKALAEFQANKAAQANPGERRLENLTKVHEYLENEKGYKISLRKVYDDKRLIKKQSDGSYLVADVDAYSRFLTKKDGSDDSDSELGKLKLQKEIELQNEKIQRERRRNEVEAGKWVPRSHVEQQLATRAAFLSSDLDAFIYAKGPEIIATVLDLPEATDEIKAILAELRAKASAELIAVYLKEKRRWLDRYAQPMQFQAPVISDIDLEEDEFEES